MLTGIALKICSAFAFTVMAALIRMIGDDVPTGEIVFFRSALALVPILVWFGLHGEIRSAVRTTSIGGHLIRTTVGASAMFCMFAGLARLSLPDSTMLTYASPLMVVGLAVVILREPLHLPRVLAVLIGLAGVGVMLWPHLANGDLIAALGGGAADTSRTSEGFLFALAGAFFTACAMIQVRRLVQSEATAAIVFYFSSFSALFALFTLPWGWVVPDLKTTAILVTIGFLGGVGQILLTQGYRFAEASVIAPFEYTTLIWSLGIGWFAFGDLPDLFALFGGLIVIGSGLIVIAYERRRGIERAKAREAEVPPG
jgi:drug/metabolite transporter (DMT)-like permease